jgi:1,4-alpha-glucan branching enzyme
VALAGDFNGWSTDETLLEDSNRDGRFVTTVALPHGDHHYMFVVDGKWVTDPTAEARRPDGFGRVNALLRI